MCCCAVPPHCRRTIKAPSSNAPAAASETPISSSVPGFRYQPTHAPLTYMHATSNTFFQPSYPALVCISCGPNRGRVWAHVVSVATDGCSPPPLPLPPPPPTSQAQSCTHLSRSRGRTAPDPYPGRTRLRTSNSFCAEHRHHCHIYVWRAICGRRRGYIEASRLCRGVEATSRRRGVEESRSLMRRIVVTGSDSTKASRSHRGHVEATL